MLLSTHPVISVVVPCYNVKRVMSKCLDSLLNQSFHDLEIILVNDGSNDGTLDCMRRYALKDDRVKIVNFLQNRGPDQARFSGIINSTGDYITFADADDWLPSNAIETLLKTAKTTGADIVEGGKIRVLGNLGLIKRISNKSRQEIETPELFDKYFISFFGINILSVNLWGKLYRRSLFDSPGVKPSEFTMGEDLVLNMRLFPYVKKYCVIPDIVYYYRLGGMTSRYNRHLYSDLKAQYYLKMNTIAKYEYYKATNFTKSEMCHVFLSQIKQMLLYWKSKKEVKSFIQQEIDSGFIDEITKNVPYPTAQFLSNKDEEMIINRVRKGLWKDRVKRVIYKCISVLNL